MAVTFDPANEAANIAKNNLSLALAGRIDMPQALVIEDDREDYGEDRFIAYGPIANELYAATFTVRGAAVHVFSLRRCGADEVATWTKLPT